jgi:hypothetical protein
MSRNICDEKSILVVCIVSVWVVVCCLLFVLLFVRESVDCDNRVSDISRVRNEKLLWLWELEQDGATTACFPRGDGRNKISGRQAETIGSEAMTNLPQEPLVGTRREATWSN